ncbi:Regulator of rDNA transcription protein 15 [Capsicum baccatum]|uniref:Regulator of rDNA transcription protein 15 n=1 Tax=Capsicum baccatum TaxID=33114 RepID=A0A2G2V111_CAPBA|nr:Regulator of rDNA transcription protein 15 [Capsicum baccatum]
MIGIADIEGSKSNVAMNAWLPQDSYTCGNFSDTSIFEFRRSYGSLGHAFTVRIRTGNQNQTSFYPSVPHEISVLVELILGHLRYLLTDVPPQPNSPPDNVFRPDRPAERALGPKRAAVPQITLREHPLGPSQFFVLINSRTPLVRTSSELVVRRAGKAPEGTIPSPSPDRHAATRSRRGSSSSSPPTADGFGTGTPVPSPQSQSFSRSYGSILPTSLAYIVPSTRGCSPWRPDAVMSTTGRGRHSVLRIFKGRRERTGHHATCGALPAAGPYLRLSRFQDERFARQYRCGPPPEFPLASPRSGIVHHLSGPDSTCSLSVSRPYLALDGIHRPIWAAFPNNPTRRQRLVVRQGPGTTGLSPSPAPPSRGLGPGLPLRTLHQTIIQTTEPPDSKAGLFPIRSPLLRESL